ncbi:MAG: ATP-binding cassette domain-containing protein [Bacteroidetes bacterium]|nr:ATP-binding cassette domain-containing protein [Bacteroidota bacterium]MBU1372081.1 ATP-binding cassette domain-containing protein [Bacteroidota bacterium]MBU1483683.1 ATP-binding cassette domain-containing protein [Bacteroidota bacterium]MBU1761610.1 ATP-binding cassette domain-containing protein [Bacteroidota bacterium]MBU2046595.1 ATP-binding cassette domain-containing protein [Bacteroidota bacterium]
MQRPLLHIQDLNLKYQNKLVFDDLSWAIQKGEQWVLSGISGSGKTTLAKAFAGLVDYAGEIEINFDIESKLPAKVLFIESWYQFKNIEGVANFYYQQRYTAQQAKDTLTVNAELAHYGKENDLAFADVEPILIALRFASLKNSQLIELSSGEHKKLQLVKALWLKPQLLIIDQPYVGLDAKSREKLNILLDQACADGVQLILISNEDELPKSINHFAEIENGKLIEISAQEIALAKSNNELGEIPEFLKEAPVYSSDLIAKMVDVNISYGEKQVLKNINWEVKAGEKWLLQGPNGSGKSTLLSLINGDHPQSYANELYLFGNPRGSGESIWDIKQHIGLISPEFHWYFDSSSTVWQSVASGFYDSVGLFQQLPYTKSKQVDELIAYFGLTENKNDLLSSLSLGKQRLVLLARTIIKNPELLILDEPCQGLDQQQTAHFNQLVDELCTNGMTVIYVGHYESQLPSCLEKRIVLENGEVKKIEKIKKENHKVQAHLELID